MKLSVKDTAMARELFSKALKNASNAMSFFTKDMVKCDVKNSQILSSVNEVVFDLNLLLNDTDYLLTTEVKGDFKGVCFLIFSEDEVRNLLSKVSMEGLENKFDIKNKLHSALLLEIDNILSASVISELSNFIGSQIYGHVPQLHRYSRDKINQLIKEANISPDTIFFLHSEFLTGHDGLRPQFIWFLDGRFLQHLQDQIFEERESQKAQS